MNMLSVQTIYPEVRTVTPAQIVTGFHDAVANEETARIVNPSWRQMLEGIEDNGDVTFHNSAFVLADMQDEEVARGNI